MTNTEVRAAIGKVFIEWYEKYVKFDFNGGKETVVKIDDSEESSDDSEKSFESNPLYDYEIGYIPEGYELKSSKEREYWRSYTYPNSEGSYISISISNSSNSSIAVDNEYYEYTEMIINGKTVHLFYDDIDLAGTLICNESDYVIKISGTVNKDEFIKIFENIKN